MDFYKNIFVILVYRNSVDLDECIDSIYLNVCSAKIIVVNAFYNMESLEAIKKIAENKNCDFVNIENKGYSYGNNYGIAYALKKYKFDYLIVSNPDIIVRKFEILDGIQGQIYAPKISAASGNQQNPMGIIENKFSEKCIYIGLKKDKKVYLLIGLAINKIIRCCCRFLFGILGKKEYKIYCAHGSFVVFRKEVFDVLNPVYDERVFLFAEEGILARKAKELGITTYYTEKIEVLHKEDGCMKLSNLSISDEMKKANVFYYETYRM